METSTPERRTAKIEARCLPSEKAAIQALADAAGMDVSAYVLACALTGKRPRVKSRPVVRTMTPDNFTRLDELGALLNSQARAVNRGRDYDPAAILQAVMALAELVRADPASAPLFRKTASMGDLPPLSAPQFEALARIGNNLNQLAAGVVFPEAAEGVRQFAGAWARALTVEADHRAALRSEAA